MNCEISSPPYLTKWIYFVVLISGAITVFSFAPFTLYPLAWFGPAVLFYAFTKAKTKTDYVKLGWIYGLGLFGVGASWPFYSLYFYANAHMVVALLGTSLFVAFVALFSTGLFGLLASLYRHYSLPLRLLLFFPAAWVLAEWFRTWFLTGFPWLFLGNTQIDSLFAAAAPITGVLGVSFLCVLVSGALLTLFLSNSARLLSAFTIVFLVATSFTLSKINWTEKTGEALTVSVLQSNIPQKVKLQSSSLLPSIDLYKEMTTKSSESDLIVWPETALFDSFDRHMESLIEPLQNSLQGTKRAILMGGFYVNERQGVENSILAITAENRSIYSKRHLVPFGEYTPFLQYFSWLKKWIELPYDNVAKGASNGIVKLNDYTAQITICYEDAFGAEMITALPEADFLINLTHDGWFTGSFEPHQHMQIARMRSLEMGRYMIRATTNGPAGIIDEKGKILSTAPIYSQSIITGKAYVMQGTTPYVRWGNWFIIMLMSSILVLGLLFKGKK